MDGFVTFTNDVCPWSIQAQRATFPPFPNIDVPQLAAFHGLQGM